MPSITRENRKIIENLWDRDLTVTRWAIGNGFNPRTVYAILEGMIKQGRVKTQVLKKLKEQGLLINGKQ